MKTLIKFLLIVSILAGAVYFVIPFSGKKNLTYPSGTVRYDGGLKNSQPDGTGKYFSENGKLLYQGQWSDGKRNGSGKEYYEDGKVAYDGTWKNDLKNGNGKEYNKNGGVQFEGTFAEGSYSGTGKSYYDSGKVRYDGSWDHGQKNGAGVEYFEDGTIKYQGNWALGVFEKEKPSFPPNILNLGYVNETADWIYYSTLKDNKSQLIKVNTANNETVVLNADTNAYYINVWRDWVYYTNASGKVQKSRTDGSKTVAIGGAAGAGEDAQFMTVRDDWIYFVGLDNGIYRMNVDGAAKTRIGNDTTFCSPMYKLIKVGWLLVEDQYIYYLNSKDRLLYKIKLDGTERTKVFNEKIEQANINNGTLYYISASDFNVYSYPLANAAAKPKKITSTGIASMISVGDTIYYVDFGTKEKKNIVKIKESNPSEKVIVADDVKGVFFCVLNEWVYYVSVKDSVYRAKSDGSGRRELL